MKTRVYNWLINRVTRLEIISLALDAGRQYVSRTNL